MKLKKALRWLKKFTNEEWKEMIRKEKEEAEKAWEEFKRNLPPKP